MLERGDAEPFPPFDRYAMYEASKGKPMAELLETFASLRAENLDDLRALRLTPEDLERRGTHPEFGPVTLKQFIAAWSSTTSATRTRSRRRRHSSTAARSALVAVPPHPAAAMRTSGPERPRAAKVDAAPPLLPVVSQRCPGPDAGTAGPAVQ